MLKRWMGGDHQHETPQAKRRQTEAVADMLLVNQQVEDMEFDEDTFDCSDWDVVTCFECNLH